MMGGKVGRFEDLEVWKEGMRPAAKIYRALNAFRDYGLRDQMQRAAVSILHPPVSILPPPSINSN